MTLEFAQEFIARWGYAGVAFGTVWDHSGLNAFTVAGGVLAGGVFAREGEPLLNPIAVALAGAAGSLLSDSVFFGIGRWSSGWIHRIVKSEKGKMRLEVLRVGLARWEFPILAFGRFIPWLGRFVPAVAGAERLNAPLAFASMTFGALFAGALYTALGYFGADLVQHFEGETMWVVLAALLISLPISAWCFKRFDRVVQARLDEEHARSLKQVSEPKQPERTAP